MAAAILVAYCALRTWSHFRAVSLTNADLTKFLPPPPVPRRLKEGCPELHSAIDAANNNSELGFRTLGQDHVAVYKAVLVDAMTRGWRRLNISVTTTPLSDRDFRNCECFDHINLENLSAAFHTSHRLINAILPTKQMKLVDEDDQSSLVRTNDPGKTIGEGKAIKDAVDIAFDTGLFSMSEIAFDKDHRHAVVSYSFWCGLLCGNGATLIFENVRGE